MWYVKSAGIFVVAAVCFSLVGSNAMVRGGGQGEHEADSGGAVYGGGGYSGGGGGGQGQEGPGGSGGVYVGGGIDSSAVGQAQVDGGNGGGSYQFQSSPAFEYSPLVGPNTMIAGQPYETYQVAVDPHYRYVNGTWFYQMPDNSFVRFDNGKWVNDNQNAGPIASRTTPQVERR